MTATSIEEQSSMTTTIQEAIEHTGKASDQMVELAVNSNDSIQKNIVVMDELRKQSEQITDTNKSVTESMQRLQEKTKNVENIAGMILNISSQTNLLALNASIESACAVRRCPPRLSVPHRSRGRVRRRRRRPSSSSQNLLVARPSTIINEYSKI